MSELAGAATATGITLLLIAMILGLIATESPSWHHPIPRDPRVARAAWLLFIIGAAFLLASFWMFALD